MASKKTDRVTIDASTGQVVKDPTKATRGEDVASRNTTWVEGSNGDPGNRRPIAIALWVLGIILEVLAIMTVKQDSPLYGRLPGNPLIWLVAFIILDLICCIIASQLWKKANHIDPPSEKNAVSFFLKSQLGAILAVIAFLPLIILTLTDKNASKQTKQVATILAAIALVAGVGTGADFNPVSAEDLAAMEQNAIELGDGTVYWTASGTVYHLNRDCHHIRNRDAFQGDARTAYEEGKTRPCKDCARADGSELIRSLSNEQETVDGTAANQSAETTDETTEESVDEAA